MYTLILWVAKASTAQVCVSQCWINFLPLYTHRQTMNKPNQLHTVAWEVTTTLSLRDKIIKSNLYSSFVHAGNSTKSSQFFSASPNLISLVTFCSFSKLSGEFPIKCTPIDVMMSSSTLSFNVVNPRRIIMTSLILKLQQVNMKFCWKMQ